MKLLYNSNDTLRRATEQQIENDQFRQFLYQQESAAIDPVVQDLNTVISPQIDCTSCGNCCQSLMINVTAPESKRLAQHLCMSEQAFNDQYIETSQQGDMIVNTIPCHFLQEKRCSIYEYRFQECRTFPGLHLPDFTGRLFSIFMHYGRCPIIYNVLEQLKVRLQWHYRPDL